MALKGIQKALEQRCNLHGFRSGGGLRVIRIEKEGKLRGYGEHYSADGALAHADEDFLAGGRRYSHVYGNLKPHYLTGSSCITGPLDGWLREGHTVDAFMKDSDIVVSLKGCVQTRTPKEVDKKVDKTRKPVVWTNRGYAYETRPDSFPNGEPCHATRVIRGPMGGDADAWFYSIVKTGTGKTFWVALNSAFKAKEVEESDS